MTPMLGIMASQISGHLVTNSFESIATVTVGSGGQSSISFSSIPSTYKHLQIRATARGTRLLSESDTLFAKFNSDTANYYTHGLVGNGAAASAYADNGNPTYFAAITASTATANNFGVAVWDVLDYANTSKYKTIRVLHGYDNNGSGTIRLTSSLWSSTAAVTSVTIAASSDNIAQYSSFALYGVKG